MSENKSDNFWESFYLAVKLGEYAEEQKRKFAVGTTEQTYWQGTADACRKICSAMRGDKLWSELYQELGKAER